VPDFDGAVVTTTGQHGGAQPAQGLYLAGVPLEGLEAPPTQQDGIVLILRRVDVFIV
jgi:hypothetical protein